MAIKTFKEIMTAVKDILKDNTSDEAIAFIEDINDTLSSNDSEEWKKKYEENDKMWREKYRDRFFEGGSTTANETEVETETEKTLKYEDLFKVKEE